MGTLGQQLAPLLRQLLRGRGVSLAMRVALGTG